jgi:putative protein kinase ArgK-like GTPase of G3E family
MRFEQEMAEKNYLMRNRQYQNVEWMHDIILFSLKQKFYADKAIRHSIESLEQEIRDKKIPAISAARELLTKYYNS